MTRATELIEAARLAHTKLGEVVTTLTVATQMQADLVGLATSTGAKLDELVNSLTAMNQLHAELVTMAGDTGAKLQEVVPAMNAANAAFLDALQHNQLLMDALGVYMGPPAVEPSEAAASEAAP